MIKINSLFPQIWDTLERDPLFAHQNVDLTLDQKRELAFKRAKRIFEYDFLPPTEALQNPAKVLAFTSAVQMYDMSTGAVFGLSRSVSRACSVPFFSKCVCVCLSVGDSGNQSQWY